VAAPATGTVNGTFSVPASVTDATQVNVELTNLNGSTLTYATVTGGASPSYQFTNVAPGQYYVYFTDETTADNVAPDYYGDDGADNIHAATAITVTSGGTTNLNPVGLRNGAVIFGTVSDANIANEHDATVYLYPNVAGDSPDPNLFPTGVVDLSNGTYTISGLPPGSYTVSYFVESTSTATPNWTLSGDYLGSSGLSYNYGDATAYTVAASTSTAINFAVPALGLISGTVSDAAGPVGDSSVDAYDLGGDSVAATDTALDGTYTLVLLPGTYKLLFGGSASANLAPTWYGGPTQAQAAGVALAAGATVPNVNVTLGAGGTITGTVVSAQGGAPLGDMEVDLVDAQGFDINDDNITLANGTYAISDVPPGTWYVRFDAGQAYSGLYYAQQFFGGTPTEFGSTGVAVTAGQTTANVNAALLPLGTAALGLPKESAAALSGLHNNKVALRFKVAAGSGSGYLHTLTVGLPKGFSWNRKKLKADLSLGTGIAFSDVITSGKLVVTLASGEPAVSFTLKAGGITVTKAIEKAAGGKVAKKKTKKKKHVLALAAKAKKKKKPAKPKDTIKSETIKLSVSDTTGLTTSLPIVVKKPH
jgi:hypothetical protein